MNVTFYASKSPIKTSDVAVSSTVQVNQGPISNTLPGCALEAEGQFQKNTCWVAMRWPLPARGPTSGGQSSSRSRVSTAPANTGLVYIGNAGRISRSP